MTARMWIFALLALAGLVVPWWFNVQFMQLKPASPVIDFVAGGYANPSASSLTSDLAIGGTAFLVFMFAEGRRLEMRHLWAYTLLFFAGAFACAAPLFFLMRERTMAQAQAQAQAQA